MGKKEDDHKKFVAMLGCLACRKLGYQDTPCELHHVRDGQGLSQRASDLKIIPLCPIHHRTGTKGDQVSVHGAPAAFKKRFGSEKQLLKEVDQLVKELKKTFVY